MNNALSNSEIEHLTTMISGCESISNHIKTGCGLSQDGQYALAVVQLHVNDAGHVAGTEGFMDAIKTGAKKGKEWLLKLIQYIKDLIKGISRDDRDRIKTIDELTKKIKWEEYDFSGETFQYAGPLGRIIALTDDANVIADLRSAVSEIDKKNVANFVTKLSRANTQLKTHVEALNKTVESETNKLDKEETPSKELSGKVKDLKNNTEAANGLSMIINKVANDMSKHYNRWEAQHKSNVNRQEELNEEKGRLEKGRNK